MLDRVFDQKIDLLKILAEWADVNASRFPETKKDREIPLASLQKEKPDPYGSLPLRLATRKVLQKAMMHTKLKHILTFPSNQPP